MRRVNWVDIVDAVQVNGRLDRAIPGLIGIHFRVLVHPKDVHGKSLPAGTVHAEIEYSGSGQRTWAQGFGPTFNSAMQDAVNCAMGYEPDNS